MEEITWSDFQKVDIRVGTITEAKVFPEARKPAYKLKIDFGEEIGIRKSSAQITDQYNTDDLLGRQVVAIVNFPPKQIGPFFSECLVLGAFNNNGEVILLNTDQRVHNGARIG